MKISKLLNITLNELVGWDVNQEYKKYVEDQKLYEEDLIDLRKRAAEISEQIKEIEEKKEKKVPRPDDDQWTWLDDMNDLPYN